MECQHCVNVAVVIEVEVGKKAFNGDVGVVCGHSFFWLYTERRRSLL
jgi:hypothetical protein